MHPRVERLLAPAEHVDDERGRRLRRRDQHFRVEHEERGLRRLARRAVHEGERLASLERDRRDARRGERLSRGTARVAPFDVALAHERLSDVRELDEVAARADGSRLGDDRVHARVQHGDERLDDDRAHRGPSLREREGADGHRGADDAARMRRAEPRRVAPHEVPLELGARVGGDGPLAERAAAGVQPVDDAARARERDELAMARFEPLAHAVAEHHGSAVGDASKRVQREGFGRREQHGIARRGRSVHAGRLAERPRTCNRSDRISRVIAAATSSSSLGDRAD